MEKYYVYFSEMSLHAPSRQVLQRTQKTLVVCDSRTGEIYLATGLYKEREACEMPDKILLGAIESEQIIHFETYKGKVTDEDFKKRVSHLTPQRLARVIKAKARFDRDGGWATLPAALEAANNGAKRFASNQLTL